MNIYKYERERGLSDIIRASCTASLVGNALSETGSKAVRLHSPGYEKAEKPYVPADMMKMHSILVSTNWNKNDDIFTPAETWKARHSPTYKPINLEHQGGEGTANSTLGFIRGCYACDDGYMPIDLPASVGDSLPKVDEPLPDYFHILTEGMLWEKYFPKSCARIRENIDKGSQYVSMEAFFDDYGYGLDPMDDGSYGAEGKKSIMMLRNEVTSWLSSHLRIYGGAGETMIDGKKYKVGRWLKDITFSGMGMVENPANPHSVVFQDYVSHASTKNKRSWEVLAEKDLKDWCVEKEIIENFNKLPHRSVLTTVAEKPILWLT